STYALSPRSRPRRRPQRYAGTPRYAVAPYRAPALAPDIPITQHYISGGCGWFRIFLPPFFCRKVFLPNRNPYQAIRTLKYFSVGTTSTSPAGRDDFHVVPVFPPPRPI